MEPSVQHKVGCLVRKTRVMTLAVSKKDVPWSAPVYFVFHDKRFYFFSNENSAHIKNAGDQKIVSASIFHDSDWMDRIFGFQMSGKVDPISNRALYLMVVNKYVAKFSFLRQIFGPGIVQNPGFFLEKFKSGLYCFCPDKIFLSDNSRTMDRRVEIDLSLWNNKDV